MTETVIAQYQLLPSLTDEEYASLKADIALRGVQVAIEVDEQGHILDGHHRVRAWHELKTEGHRLDQYARNVRVGMSEDEKTHHVLSLNLERRHLSREQRRELTVRLRSLGWSTRQIADVEKVSHTSVERDLEATGTNVPVASVVGKDGKRRQAQKPKRTTTVHVVSNRQAAEVIAKAQQGALLPERGEINLRTVRESKGAAVPLDEPSDALILPSTMDIREADFHDLLMELPVHSVDAIVTDPPYPEKFLPLYSDLAQLACRVVKPGGSVLVMSGQTHFPEVIRRLSEYLLYRWTICYLTPGSHTEVFGRKIWSWWKPVVWLTAGPPTNPEHRTDLVRSDREDKRFHDWGQSETGMADLVDRFTEPGSTILDPFLGAGTTGVVALRLGRNFIGCDVDPVAVRSAIQRLTAV